MSEIKILFGEVPKRAKKRERIKKKQSKKINAISQSHSEGEKFLQRLNNAWDSFEKRYNSQRGFLNFEGSASSTNQKSRTVDESSGDGESLDFDNPLVDSNYPESDTIFDDIEEETLIFDNIWNNDVLGEKDHLFYD